MELRSDMTNSSNRRGDARVKHQANIQIRTSDAVMTLEMRDFSDSGLYVFCADTDAIAINDRIKVQTLEFDDAPVLDAIVVRLEDNIGFAVRFVQ